MLVKAVLDYIPEVNEKGDPIEGSSIGLSGFYSVMSAMRNTLLYHPDENLLEIRRDLLKGILPYENDIAYEWCINLAKDFEVSDFNVNTKGLYECLEEYVKANFYLDDNGNMSFRGHDLYETIGGVRI